VTEWTQWPCWRRLVAIARAPAGRSAVATGALAAASLAELVEGLAEYAPEDYPRAVQEIAEELAERRAAVAPLVSLVNTVYLTLGAGMPALAAELHGVERRMAASAGILARVGAELIEEDGIVLTHGGSGSVQALLTHAAESRRFFVSCLATLPEGEGIELAADLAAAGLHVEVAPDDQVAEVLPDVDLVVVGADALGPRRLMSAAGTASLAAETHSLGVPFYVLASVDKALPAPLFERAVAAGRIDGRYEATDLGLVTAVVTERGVLDPREAADLAEDREVSPALLALSPGPA
jgi:translation initiation factor 2B subunit (eIF-2B alpha/beta/delta family)